jgi:hypothetical protein
LFGFDRAAAKGGLFFAGRKVEWFRQSEMTANKILPRAEALLRMTIGCIQLIATPETRHATFLRGIFVENVQAGLGVGYRLGFFARRGGLRMTTLKVCRDARGRMRT